GTQVVTWVPARRPVCRRDDLGAGAGGRLRRRGAPLLRRGRGTPRTDHSHPGSRVRTQVLTWVPARRPVRRRGRAPPTPRWAGSCRWAALACRHDLHHTRRRTRLDRTAVRAAGVALAPAAAAAL